MNNNELIEQIKNPQTPLRNKIPLILDLAEQRNREIYPLILAALDSAEYANVRGTLIYALDLLRKYPENLQSQMKYENLIQRSNREFKRLTGVTPVLFHEMLQITTEAESRKVKSGRPHTLSLADQLLLTLSYLRHYHTQLELAAIYGLSESNVCRTIRKTEDALIRCKRFSLPKHKNLCDQTVIIDVTESPIERPKKTAAVLQRQEKAAHG